MESIIASDIKSFLFSNGLISGHQFGFKAGHSTQDCSCFPNNGWRFSMPDMRSEPSPSIYRLLSIWSGTPPCSPNSLPTVSKGISTHGSQTSSPVAANVWPFMEFTRPSSCLGWSSSRWCSGPSAFSHFQHSSLRFSGKSSSSLC